MSLRRTADAKHTRKFHVRYQVTIRAGTASVVLRIFKYNYTLQITKNPLAIKAKGLTIFTIFV
jgi:hypothetical protein